MSKHNREQIVYERYPISGIKQSYRPVPGTKTVVMPLLIAALGIGMVVFYFNGRPPMEVPQAATPLISTATAPAHSVVTPVPEKGILPEPVKAPGTGDTTTTAEVPPSAAKTLPLVTREGVADRDFTPWMSPLALDTFIRQRNRGFTKTYWERGHCIEAVEGRWENGAHEFRIAIDMLHDQNRFQWYYRIDQTEAIFAETLDRLEKEGYTLAQSHAYDHPDGTKRYQGVWQRETSTLTASEGAPGLIESAPGMQALDVSQLNFR